MNWLRRLLNHVNARRRAVIESLESCRLLDGELLENGGFEEESASGAADWGLRQVMLRRRIQLVGATVLALMFLVSPLVLASPGAMVSYFVLMGVTGLLLSVVAIGWMRAVAVCATLLVLWLAVRDYQAGVRFQQKFRGTLSPQSFTSQPTSATATAPSN